MSYYTRSLIYPQPIHVNEAQESWHFLECPSNHAVYNPFPGDKSRRMWLLLPPRILVVMLQNGWREVQP